MLLYIWIDKFRNLENIGFNFSSKYEFVFEKKGDLNGNLGVQEIDTVGLFEDYIGDLKAIIGKNGTGKSSMIEAVLRAFFEHTSHSFPGIVVTDKYIFNRKGYKIEGDISINGHKLESLTNVAIANFNRGDKPMLSEARAASYPRQIVGMVLNEYSFFYYSPLLNYDRVHESEGVVAGNEVFEIHQYLFNDLSTEAQIITDFKDFSPFEYRHIAEGSELLCHKSREAERILEYLLDEGDDLPISLQIPIIEIHLNEFSKSYWNTINILFKQDDQLETMFHHIFNRIEISESHVEETTWRAFEQQLYENFILFLLRYELDNRYNSGDYGNGNEITSLLNLFVGVGEKARTMDELLRLLLGSSSLFKSDFPSLFKQIQGFIEVLRGYYERGVINVFENYFTIQRTDRDAIMNILTSMKSFYGHRKSINGRTKIFLPVTIFSFYFSGLSSGEKSMLHMLSRFHHYIKKLPNDIRQLVIFMDEPEVGFHPQWQKRLITILCVFLKKRLKGRRGQLIITGHSPIVISDLPAEHIIFLDHQETSNTVQIKKLTTIKNTFAANIHALYADAFFIQKGTIGEFAKAKVKQILKVIETKDVLHKESAAKLISIIGDTLVRQRLFDLFEKTFGQRVESLQERLERLEREVEYVKKQMKNDNANKR